MSSSLPVTSELKDTLRRGAFSCLRSLSPSAEAVTVMLEEIWTFWIMPLLAEQKRPRSTPSATETSADSRPSHSCTPGTDWYRLPCGELSSTLPCSGTFKTHLTWLRDGDRHESNTGMVRRVPATGHEDKLTHPEDERGQESVWGRI